MRTSSNYNPSPHSVSNNSHPSYNTPYFNHTSTNSNSAPPDHYSSYMYAQQSQWGQTVQQQWVQQAQHSTSSVASIHDVSTPCTSPVTPPTMQHHHSPHPVLNGSSASITPSPEMHTCTSSSSPSNSTSLGDQQCLDGLTAAVSSLAALTPEVNAESFPNSLAYDYSYMPLDSTSSAYNTHTLNHAQCVYSQY